MGSERTDVAEAGNSPHIATVLVVDDEQSFHDIVEPYLTSYRILRAYNALDAMQRLAKHHVDVVLLDLNLPGTTGLNLLDTMRRERDDVEVIIITAHSEIPHAVDAVKRGAFDFLAKTYENYQRLGEHIERALINRRRRREQLEAKTKEAWLRDAFLTLEHTKSRRMTAVLQLARRVAETPLTVLLQGESGVGKEIMARYVHACSDRVDRPFVAVHLAARPETLIESDLFGHVKGAFTGATKERIGKFELADSGTLFLDEIGELDHKMQVKLLRVLQEREVERLGAHEPSPVDVRVIAATNKNLKHEMDAGRFREDLYYRLNVIQLDLPPLRERQADLSALIKLLCGKHAVQMNRAVPTFTSDALTILRNYDWPGNIRELENLVQRLVALAPGKAITADDIPLEYCLETLNDMATDAARMDGRADKEERFYFLARERFERYLVRLMVNRYRGDRPAAAKALGVSMTTIKNKLRGGDPDWLVDIRRTLKKSPPSAPIEPPPDSDDPGKGPW